MKKVLWLIMLSGWWLSGHAQPQGGEDQYYYLTPAKTFTLVPVVYYQTNDNWYMEGRYNYEALKTFSFYAGRTFGKQATFSYSVSPVAGLVVGEYRGASLGANVECDYKKVFLSSQFQYTFSWQNRKEDFVYSWTDLSYQLSKKIYLGLSLQQTNVYNEQPRLEHGFFTKAVFKKWSVPLYVFQPEKDERYYVLGLSREW